MAWLMAAPVRWWRGRFDRAIDVAGLRLTDADGAAAKICAMFDQPIDRAPFVGRPLRLIDFVRGGADAAACQGLAHLADLALQ